MSQELRSGYLHPPVPQFPQQWLVGWFRKRGKEEDEGSAETCHGVLRLPGPRIPGQGVEGGWEGDPVRDREDPAGNGHPAGSRYIRWWDVWEAEPAGSRKPLDSQGVLGADVIAAFFD